MNITIITPTFPYPNRGLFPGFERYMENIAIYLKEIGNNVKIVTTFWNGGLRYDEFNGIPILRITESKKVLGKLGSLFYLNYTTFGFNLFRKKNFEFFQDSDVVLGAFAMPFSTLFKKKGLKFISIFLHYDKIESTGDLLTYPALHLLQKIQYKKNEFVITISDASKRDLINHYNLINKNIISIPLGIDFTKFNPSNYSKQIREEYGSDILFYSGLMVPRKRIPILLNAFRFVLQELPQVTLILAGDGPFLNKYKSLSKKLNIDTHVIFTGFLDEPSLQQFYATSDIYILPSELEGFGQVVLEAMASGTPVICANKPPMSDIVSAAGFTFNAGDPKDLSQKILKLLTNKNLIEEKGKKGIEIAKNYEWKKIAKIYENYIKNVIK